MRRRLLVKLLLPAAFAAGLAAAALASTGGAARLESPVGSFTNLGPAPDRVASERSSPYTGRVEAIALDPRAHSTAYVGGYDGGVWKTIDDGRTWRPLFDGAPSLRVESLEVDPLRPSLVYMATGYEDAGAGLFRSTDGGRTWSPFAAFAGCEVPQALVDPSDDRIVLADARCGASGRYGLFRSADGGRTWRLVLGGLPPGSNETLAVSPALPRVWFAAMQSASTYAVRLFRSTDHGAHWRPLGHGLPADLGLGVRLAVAPSNGKVVYLTASPPGDASPELYVSTSAGERWHRFPAPAPAAALAVSPSNPRTVIVGQAGLHRSTDGGASFTDVLRGDPPGPDPLLHMDVASLAFETGGKPSLWIGGDGGLYRTGTLGRSYENLNTNLSITLVYGIFVVAGGAKGPSICEGAQDNGLAVYPGSGIVWNGAGSGDAGQCAIDPTNTALVYSAGVNPDIPVGRSSDGGRTFVPAASGIDRSDPRAFIGPLELDRGSPRVLFYGTDRVWENTDGGLVPWTPISPHLACAGAPGACWLVALGVSAASARTVYALTETGDLYATTDGGGHWAHGGLALPSGDGIDAGEIDVDPGSPSRAYATGGSLAAGRIAATVDSGSTWTNVPGPGPDEPTYSIAADWALPSPTLYVGTEDGLFWSADAGASWNLATGLPRTRVTDLYLDPVRRDLYVGTFGRGVWVTHLTITAPPPPPPPTTATTATTTATTATTTTGTTTTAPALSPSLTITPSGKGSWVISGKGWDTCGNAVALSDNGKQFATATPDSAGSFQLTTGAVASGDVVSGQQKRCDGNGTLSAKATVP